MHGEGVILEINQASSTMISFWFSESSLSVDSNAFPFGTVFCLVVLLCCPKTNYIHCSLEAGMPALTEASGTEEGAALERSEGAEAPSCDGTCSRSCYQGSYLKRSMALKTAYDPYTLLDLHVVLKAV